MDVFQFRERLIGDYESFTRSFTKPQAEDIKAYLQERYDAGVFWPAPLIQLECIYREQAGPATRINLQRFQYLHPDGQHLVRSWFAQAYAAMTDDEECFEAFIFAWFAVNGWAACVTEKDRDADYIRALQRAPELVEKFPTLLDGDLPGAQSIPWREVGPFGNLITHEAQLLSQWG